MSNAIPAKGLCAIRRIPNRALAAEYGCGENYVGRVLNGDVRPSPRFRAWLAERLQTPEHDLFTDRDLVQ